MFEENMSWRKTVETDNGITVSPTMGYEIVSMEGHLDTEKVKITAYMKDRMLRENDTDLRGKDLATFYVLSDNAVLSEKELTAYTEACNRIEGAIETMGNGSSVQFNENDFNGYPVKITVQKENDEYTVKAELVNESEIDSELSKFIQPVPVESLFTGSSSDAINKITEEYLADFFSRDTIAKEWVNREALDEEINGQVYSLVMKASELSEGERAEVCFEDYNFFLVEASVTLKDDKLVMKAECQLYPDVTAVVEEEFEYTDDLGDRLREIGKGELSCRTFYEEKTKTKERIEVERC